MTTTQEHTMDRISERTATAKRMAGITSSVTHFRTVQDAESDGDVWEVRHPITDVLEGQVRREDGQYHPYDFVGGSLSVPCSRLAIAFAVIEAA